jgi:hypothetical protein
MISLLAIPPGDMCAAALLLVVAPGLRGLQVEAAILLVVGPRLTDGCVEEVEGADTFLDFFEAFLGLDVLPFSFLFLYNSKVSAILNKKIVTAIVRGVNLP